MGPSYVAPLEWLIYAPGSDVLTAIGRIDVHAHFVDSSPAFRAALTSEQPRIVLLAIPPGTVDDVALLGQERSQRRGITAVVLTADDAAEDRQMALTAGIDEALPFAISGDELLRRLEAWRPQRLLEDDTPPLLPIGDRLAVALQLHELRRGDAVVHLRPREHALLVLLASHPDRIFSRRELLDSAWGPEHDGDPRTVDVHVRWLREKLEEDPSAPRYLLTVRGLGYRMAPARER